MKPFFPYFGSKWRASRQWRPHANVIIEPFAGAAGYATYWEPQAALLIDLDPKIIGVWHYLQRASRAEVLALPELETGEDVRDFGLSQEAQWLVGLWINKGAATPRYKRTAWTTQKGGGWSESKRLRIADQKHKIEHWVIRQADYRTLGNVSATWFVDPPYQDQGKHYPHGSAGIDYGHLGRWCRSRAGQVIVCEQDGATWLPFGSNGHHKSTKGSSHEAVWLG